MTVSHVNDSYFWVVTKYSNLEIKEVVKFFTTATLVTQFYHRLSINRHIPVQGLIGLLKSISVRV